MPVTAAARLAHRLTLKAVANGQRLGVVATAMRHALAALKMGRIDEAIAVLEAAERGDKPPPTTPVTSDGG